MPLNQYDKIYNFNKRVIPDPARKVIHFWYGVIHKPRGQLKGEGFSQMTILLDKAKVTTYRGRVGQIYPKFMNLWMTPTATYVWTIYFVDVNNIYEIPIFRVILCHNMRNTKTFPV